MIYEKKRVDLDLETDTLDLSDADAVKLIAGLSSTDGIKEIAVSEPMMGSRRIPCAWCACPTAQTPRRSHRP